MDDSLIIERNGRIATVTLNRPDARNAFSSVEQARHFASTVTELAEDEGISVLVLTGAGSAFCAGGDVKDMQAGTGFAAGTASDLRDRYRHEVQRMNEALYRVEVATIAMVNGPAIGLGCDLACSCDIRIASERARFAESFIKLGLIPGDGGAYFLQQIVGYAKAAELSLTGDVIDAREAERIGLVSSVVPAADLQQTVTELAERMAANPPKTLRLTKRLLREAQHARLDAVFELSAAFQAISQKTDDHREAVNAAIDKRPPVFSGR